MNPRRRGFEPRAGGPAGDGESPARVAPRSRPTQALPALAVLAAIDLQFCFAILPPFE
jgi:hypothetical protein